MAELDLSGVEAKFAWARLHFEMVEKKIGLWHPRGGNSLILQQNEDFTQWYLQAEMNGPKPDLLRWSLMIGDCLTN